MEMELFLREILIETRSYHRRGNNRHRLNFVEELKNDGQEEVVCEECEEPAAVGPTFKCRVCRYLCHVSCFDSSSTLYIHFGRRHDQLKFAEEMKNDVNAGVACMACQEKIEGPGYKCSAFECNFQLHKSCAQLPRKMDHPSHPNHILILEMPGDSAGNCNACDPYRVSDSRAEYYSLPQKSVDVMKINPETLKHEGHQHSLFLSIISNKNCNVCDHVFEDNGVFICNDCDFALGFECATLPLIAWHKYDEHLLALTYVAEEDSKEYYCLICEEERDLNHWFYYCAKCDFPAHRECVLGAYPYIKFGSTFKDDEYHQHPITFIRTTEYSPPCDACGMTFDGVALECAQCKFKVHYEYTLVCLKEMSNKVLHP
ncbi:uncharacterized protein LOC132191580 [Corylus avellana]|uniref:uncharacterized protein LOC132191580 n=1 Tax=Corylus avellana TaxID=13451 RepID=UPI00286B347B|nr:uncharacterized protein LOC132191580 [Corylus avellana]